MCKIQKLIVSYIISSCYAQNNHHDTDMDTITSEPLPVNDHISPVILRLNKGLDEVLNIQRQADDQQVLMQEMSRSIESGDIRLLDNYGCWCNFENNGVRGIRKGLPVDNFDQACKTLHEGYECINMDTNFQCDLKNTVYKSAVGGGSTSPMNLDRLQFECEKSNKAANEKDQQFAADGSSLDCKIKLCKVEGWFIQTIFKIVYREMVFPNRPKYAMAFGNFGREEVCKLPKNPGPTTRACCGDYPIRFPYRDTNRGCCQGKTYNSITLQCCDDGSAKAFCES